MANDWERRLAEWQAELELISQLEEIHWVPLGRAVEEVGVSRSTLRSWYRSGAIPSRLVDSPNGPQRLIPLDAVITRAARSPRLQRRAERAASLEGEVALLRNRLDQIERRLAAVEEARLPRSEERRV